MFGMARLYRARRKRTIGRILISAHPPQGFPHPQSRLILRIDILKVDAALSLSLLSSSVALLS